MKWPGNVTHMVNRNLYTVLTGKTEGKNPHGRPRQRSEDNIKMDLKYSGWEDTDWISSDQHRDKWQAAVNTEMNLWVP